VKRKYSIQIEEDAKNDIAESYEWYRNILPSLAEDFLDQIENTLKYLEDNPLQFQFAHNTENSSFSSNLVTFTEICKLIS